MKLVEKEDAYFIENFFSFSLAGFTKSSLKGRDPEKEVKNVLSFLKEFKVSFLNQRHSFKINFIEKEGIYEGDGLFTKKENLVLIVKSADCLPVLLEDEEKKIIGALHLGWRSLKEGILKNINFSLSSFKVFVGVGLRKCCYRVGEEFLNYPYLKDFVLRKKDNFYFDVIAFLKNFLFEKGLKEKNFFDLNLCSFCGEFFSYRRTRTFFRTLTFIMKNERDN
jgi:hypothetical protein